MFVVKMARMPREGGLIREFRLRMSSEHYPRFQRSHAGFRHQKLKPAPALAPACGNVGMPPESHSSRIAAGKQVCLRAHTPTERAVGAVREEKVYDEENP